MQGLIDNQQVSKHKLKWKLCFTIYYFWKKNFETLLTSGEDQGFQAAGGGGGRNCCSQSRQVSTGELLSGTSFCQLLWVVRKSFANFSRTQVDTTNETGPQLGPVKIKIWSLILNRKLSRFRDVFWKVMNALRWWNISKAMRCAEIMLHICWMIPFWYQICSFYLERENFWHWYLTTRWQNKLWQSSAFGGVLLPLGHSCKLKKPSKTILSRYPLYL